MVNEGKGNLVRFCFLFKDKHPLIISLFTFNFVDEAAKISHHLSLLREEYNKLQARHTEVLRQLGASSGEHSNTFLARILKFVANLHLSQNLR